MYTIWCNSSRLAYKTRPAFNPRHGLTRGVDEYVEETAYWYEPEAVVAGLSAVQAQAVLNALTAVANVPTDIESAKTLALESRRDVRLVYHWVTRDGQGYENEINITEECNKHDAVDVAR